MRRLIHLSDLHFGRPQPLALDSLRRFLQEQVESIDLVVSTGDWTQRARSHEFLEAAEFIKALPIKTLSVPGNHDVPLYNLPVRFFTPFRRYRKYITPVTIASYSDQEISVIGLSSVNTHAVAGGYLKNTEVARAKDFFGESAQKCFRIIACHHPTFDPRTSEWIRPEGRGEELMRLQPHLVLSGHNHLSSVDLVEMPSGSKTVFVSAGTVLSNRLRGEANSFHMIEIEQFKLRVLTWTLSDTGFIQSEPAIEKDLTPS